MSNSNLIRHIYIRDTHDRPIGCIAVRVMRSKNRAEYGLAMRHPKDAVDEKHRMIKLDRQLAQQLAEAELDTDPKRTYISNEADFHEVTAAVLSNVIANAAAPTRAIRFAKRWLNNMQEI